MTDKEIQNKATEAVLKSLIDLYLSLKEKYNNLRCTESNTILLNDVFYLTSLEVANDFINGFLDVVSYDSGLRFFETHKEKDEIKVMYKEIQTLSSMINELNNKLYRGI